jgi:hypothetical protein
MKRTFPKLIGGHERNFTECLLRGRANNIVEHIEGHENNIAERVGGDEKNVAECHR